MRKVLKICAALAALLFLAPASADETVTYVYDSLGRLISTTVSGGPASGVQTTTNFDAASNRSNYSVTGVPIPTFSINSVSATEGSALVFTITKSGTATGSLSVNYATTDATALSSSDYTNTSGTVTFLASDTTKTISVPTIDDIAVEGNETFTMTLSGASAGSVIGTAVGTGTIVDNDAYPSFAVANAATVTEGGTLVFTVTKTGSTTVSYSVNYGSAGGTATSGSDFTATSGILTFLAGDTTKTISVPTIDDSVAESAETVLMNLSSPTGGATITTGQGVGIIADNDSGNQPPVANADTYSARCNAMNSFANLLTNDTDPEGNTPLVLVSVTRTSGNATITINNSGGGVTVTAAPSVGVSTFTYVVQDSLGASSTGNVTVNTNSGPMCT